MFNPNFTIPVVNPVDISCSYLYQRSTGMGHFGLEELVRMKTQCHVKRMEIICKSQITQLKDFDSINF